MTEPTEAQRAKAREDARAILDRVMRGESDPAPARKRRTPSEDKPVKPQRTRSEATRKYDYDEIKRLYVDENMSSAAIAEKLSCHRKTVVKALLQAGVWQPAREGKGGRPLAEVCARGHEQAVWRRESTPGKADWHCGRCKLDRNADHQARRTALRRINTVTPKPGQDTDDANILWEVTLEGKHVGDLFGPAAVAEALDKKLRSLSRRRGLPADA